MKMLVTGAAGFIGSHVSEWLITQGHEVLGLDDLSGGFQENIPAGVKFENKSVLEPLDELFLSYRPEVVYHLAAYAAEGLSHHIPVFNYQNNLAATANVLGSAYRAGTRHFVLTSSIAAYGHPQGGAAFDESSPCVPCDPYGIAKFACELHLKSHFQYHGGPSYTIFRPHNVFGPRQNIADPYRNVVGIFILKALQGLPMPIFGDGTQTRSFSYVSLVARCIAEAGQLAEAKNLTVNIGGDQSLSVRELAHEIAVAVDLPENIAWLPARHEVAHAHCDHQLARTLFKDAYGTEVSIREGLEEMIKYVRSHPIPEATECPAPIEIQDHLPPSWLNRLLET
jgi:UDP-glucose 4-epimerase